ncbi:hypothetical protein S245_013048 [Arachis hypogaea]
MAHHQVLKLCLLLLGLLLANPLAIATNSNNKPQIIMFQFESISFPPIPGPAKAPQSDEKKVHYSDVEAHSEVLGSSFHHDVYYHHSFDKSIAGACVILGGLATTFLASVFCYGHQRYCYSSNSASFPLGVSAANSTPNITILLVFIISLLHPIFSVLWTYLC